ncbi:MAG: ParB/RepB/Spo0J family partition protein [Lachnospiraceae bacterium]|nr:ParB/RepB/Spo0J family partition protein [Lachnospiraceae bacterium]
MAAKSRGLGKGLDSLIPVGKVGVESSAKKESKEEKGPVTIVNINKVEPNREQPRRQFDEDKLLELADSLKKFGILEPLIVKDRKKYLEIVAGERRWRAAKLAGLKEVPVIKKDLTEQEIVEIALIENLQREDLNDIEEALAYKRLIEEFHLKQEELAERVSKTRSVIANSLRLLKLTEEVQKMIIDEKISAGHARALIMVEDPKQQIELAERVFDERLNVRDTEKLVKELGKEKKEKQKKEIDAALKAIYEKMEEKLKAQLGTKVSVVPKENGVGKIEIEFYSHDEFDRIISHIK